MPAMISKLLISYWFCVFLYIKWYLRQRECWFLIELIEWCNIVDTGHPGLSLIQQEVFLQLLSNICVDVVSVLVSCPQLSWSCFTRQLTINTNWSIQLNKPNLTTGQDWIIFFDRSTSRIVFVALLVRAVITVGISRGLLRRLIMCEI